MHARTRRGLILALLGTAVFAAPALAAIGTAPEKGKTYSGDVQKTGSPYPISFKVSKSGKSVSHFKLEGFVFYCSGGGFPTVEKGKPARVSSTGTFKASLPLVFTPTGKHEGAVVVTGKFGSGGSEKGEVITKFKGNKPCSGKSPYTTTAS